MIESVEDRRTLAGGAARCVSGLLCGSRRRPHRHRRPVRGPPLSLDGVVDPFVADYLRDGIEGAQDGAAAVLIAIDTPGGLDSSMREIIQAVLASQTPVICYVAPAGARAASAGTFILLSCPVAAMAPGTNVGAATPVGVVGAVAPTRSTKDAAAYDPIAGRAARPQRGLAPSGRPRGGEHHPPRRRSTANVIDADRELGAELLDELDGHDGQVARRSDR